MLLRKGVYPFEYMNKWEKEPEKEEFYSNLHMEDITDTDYMHAKRVCKGFEIKYLGEYHDLICIWLKVIKCFWLMFSTTSEKCV